MPFLSKVQTKCQGFDCTHLLNLELKNAYKSLSCFPSTTLNLTLPCFRERNKEGQLWNMVVLQPEVEMTSIATEDNNSSQSLVFSSPKFPFYPSLTPSISTYITYWFPFVAWIKISSFSLLYEK